MINPLIFLTDEAIRNDFIGYELRGRHSGAASSEPMTVYEFLLLEEVCDVEAYLAAAADTEFTDWIGLKARTEVAALNQERDGDLKGGLALRKAQLAQAGERCRQHFSMMPRDRERLAAVSCFLYDLDRKKIRAEARRAGKSQSAEAQHEGE